MRKITQLLFTFLLFAGTNAAFSQEKTGKNLEASTFINLFKEGLKGNNLKIVTANDSFVTLTNIEQNSFQQKMSVTGTIKEWPNSTFLFKINKESFYGYVINLAEEIAFEYTTFNGAINVTQVEMHKLLHILDIEKTKNKKNRSLENQEPNVHIETAEYPHLSNYQPGMDLTQLESKPGSQYVMFLDMRAVFNGKNPKYISHEEMYKAWQGTATAFCPFDVNVTTNVDVYNAANVINTCIALFIDADGRSHAYLNSFGTTKTSSLYRNGTGEAYALTLAHEIGHQYGLIHDGGQPGGEYYEGIPEYDWNSYMGNFWYTKFNQWSKGEYKGANNQQDDLVDITNYTPYRNDDNTTSKELIFDQGSGKISIENNIGLIERNTDEDVFTLDISTIGIANLKIETTEYLTMLDIEARIVDPNGNIIAKSNASKERHAEFNSIPLAIPGTYQLIIKGGAEGTPQQGFSNYGSLGMYGISGEVAGSVSNDGVSVSIVQFNPFPTVCEEIEPTVKILNSGDETIQSLEIKYTVGNNTAAFVSKTGLNLTQGNSIDVALPTINQKGKGINYEVIITKVNGVQISSSPLTNRGITYTLGTGTEMILAVTQSVADQFDWEIKNNAGTIVSNTSFVAQTVNKAGYQNMRFCLTDDCFNLELPAPENLCVSYQKWSAGSTYGVQGTKVYHTATDGSGNFIIYSNKWWAGSSDVPGNGGPWEEVGSCSASTDSPGDFTLKSIHSNDALISSDFGGANDELVFNFCTSSITTVSNVSVINYSYGPNPFTDKTKIDWDKGDYSRYKIYSVSGALVEENEIQNQSHIIVGGNLPKGVYLVTLSNSFQQVQFKIIKN